jgi:hypothetical protein
MWLSTYARLFIGFSMSMSRIIKKYSRQSQTKQLKLSPITMISNEQVDESILHPHNKAVKEVIGSSYSSSIKIDRLMIKYQDHLDGQRIFIEEILKLLREKNKQLLDWGSDTQHIQDARKNLNRQFKLLDQVQGDIDDAYQQLSDVRQSIAKVVERGDNAWVEYRTELLDKLREQIVNLLARAKLHIPQGEIDNLLRQDLQDVEDRFIDLGANKDFPPEELEQILGLEHPDFDTYFKKKAYLAIRSVAVGNKEQIRGVMKELNPFFEEARKAGNRLYNEQGAQVQAIDEQKVRPILQLISSGQTLLAAIESDCNALLESVTSRDDIQSIYNRTFERISKVKPREVPGLTM